MLGSCQSSLQGRTLSIAFGNACAVRVCALAGLPAATPTRSASVAVYHCKLNAISRADGRSATAAAAYRAGERLEDELLGQVFDYTRREGVLHAGIVVPAAVHSAPTRTALWNAVEAAERRKDSKLARELVLALPHELDQADQAMLLDSYAHQIAERYGVAVDVALHAPHRKNQVELGGEQAIGGDERNVHAHLLFTTRAMNPDGSLGAKTRALDVKATSAAEVHWMRQAWQDAANAALAAADQAARVDCRSLRDRGLNREPQVHIGPREAGRLANRGGRSRRVAAWRAINAANERLAQAAADGVIARQIDRQLAQMSRVAQDATQQLAAIAAEQRQAAQQLRPGAIEVQSAPRSRPRHQSAPVPTPARVRTTLHDVRQLDEETLVDFRGFQAKLAAQGKQDPEWMQLSVYEQVCANQGYPLRLLDVPQDVPPAPESAPVATAPPVPAGPPQPSSGLQNRPGTSNRPK